MRTALPEHLKMLKCFLMFFWGVFQKVKDLATYKCMNIILIIQIVMHVLVKCVSSYFQSDSNLWFFTLKYLKHIKKSAWATQWSYLGKFHMNVICRYSPRTFCCSTCASTLLTGNSGGSSPSGFNIKKERFLLLTSVSFTSFSFA